MRTTNLPGRKAANGAAVANNGIAHICVYCGSGKGRNPAYATAARQLGKSLAKAGIGLVYGGGSLGLMGEVARSTLKHGGHVTGIIPKFLSARERMLTDVDELIVTEDMHERKMMMFNKADAFVALPGGIGTLEELIEQLTWAQLGQHRKPIVIANIGGYGTPVMIATGEANFVGLYSYMLILGCGSFGISLRKNWHLLNYLGFACNYGLAIAALQKYHQDEFWRVMPFFVAFFVLYSTTLFVFCVVHRTKSTLLELLGHMHDAGFLNKPFMPGAAEARYHVVTRIEDVLPHTLALLKPNPAAAADSDIARRF